MDEGETPRYGEVMLLSMRSEELGTPIWRCRSLRGVDPLVNTFTIYKAFPITCHLAFFHFTIGVQSKVSCKSYYAKVTIELNKWNGVLISMRYSN